MPRKLGVLVFAAVLLVASFALRWYGTGGAAQRLDPEDSRVTAALGYLSRLDSASDLVRSGTMLKAWLSPAGSGCKVNVAFELNRYPWRASVVFDAGGTALSGAANLWGGSLFPDFLRGLGLALCGLWVLVALVLPNAFGAKCPDCPRNLLRPPLLDIEESTVYSGGFDAEGFDLSPIVRCDFICPRCGYRRITYTTPIGHSAGRAFWAGGNEVKPFVTTRGRTPEEDKWYDKALETWFARRQGSAGFHDYDEWTAFYDDLKASEREERETPPLP